MDSYDALRREVREEISADFEVGPLLFVTEYVPSHHEYKYGSTQSLGLYFYCRLRAASEPEQPQTLVDVQEGVYWLPISELDHVPLLPSIGKQIKAALADGPATNDPFISDWR